MTSGDPLFPDEPAPSEVIRPEVVQPVSTDELETLVALLTLVGAAALAGSFPPGLAPMVQKALGAHGTNMAVGYQVERAKLSPAMVMMIRGTQR